MKTILITTVLIVGSMVCAEPRHSVPATTTPPLADVLAARTNDIVAISLDTNETIRIGGRITSPEEIDGISRIAGLSNSTPFVIEAARNVKHSSIRRVMDSLAKQKFWKISFRVKKEAARQPSALAAIGETSVPTRGRSVDDTPIGQTASGSDRAVLELLLGGQHQYKMYYLSTCGRQLDQFKREYPSVPKEFWGEHAVTLESEWVRDSISAVRTHLTADQFRELATFAASPTGRTLAQEQLLILKEFQSAARQQERDRRTTLQSVLQKKGYKKAVSLQNCIYNLRLIDSAKEQHAMANRRKAGDVASADKISPYIKGGFKSRICPNGGTYTINSIGEKPVCSVDEHKLD